MKLSDLTDKLVTITLARTGGNRAKAAKELGIPIRSLHRFIKERTEKDEKDG
jgi:DNA-binding NtrC family response regulator